MVGPCMHVLLVHMATVDIYVHVHDNLKSSGHGRRSTRRHPLFRFGELSRFFKNFVLLAFQDF